MFHYPKNEKHAKDQWADGSRINSDAYRSGWDRVFGSAAESSSSSLPYRWTCAHCGVDFSEGDVDMGDHMKGHEVAP